VISASATTKSNAQTNIMVANISADVLNVSISISSQALEKMKTVGELRTSGIDKGPKEPSEVPPPEIIKSQQEPVINVPTIPRVDRMPDIPEQTGSVAAGSELRGLPEEYFPILPEEEEKNEKAQDRELTIRNLLAISGAPAAETANEEEDSKLKLQSKRVTLKPGGIYKKTLSPKKPVGVQIKVGWDQPSADVRLAIEPQQGVVEYTTSKEGGEAGGAVQVGGGQKATISITNTSTASLSLTVSIIVSKLIPNEAELTAVSNIIAAERRDRIEAQIDHRLNQSIIEPVELKVLDADILIDERYKEIVNKKGAGEFGNFRFQTREDDCTISIYDRSAIAAYADSTKVIRGAIFNKWIELRGFGQNAPSRSLGCPRFEEEELPMNALGCTDDSKRGFKVSIKHGSSPGKSEVLAQSFSKGRIYTNLPTGSGTFYVPSMFQQPIDALVTSVAIGVPLDDPQTSPLNGITAFQQFHCVGQPLASSIELRGLDPKTNEERLWLETQALNLSYLKHLRYGWDDSRSKVPGIPSMHQSPTVVEEIIRDAGGYKIAQTQSGTPEQIRAACDDKVFPFQRISQWAPVDKKNQDREVVGIIRPIYNSEKMPTRAAGIKKAGIDFPFTHECFKDLAKTFSADWDLYLTPHPLYDNMKAGVKPLINVEFERCQSEEFLPQSISSNRGRPLDRSTRHALSTIPRVGDLIFAYGRHIADCGHRDRKEPKSFTTEIHPPYVMALMRTNYRILERLKSTCSATKPRYCNIEPGPATELILWVNPYYYGDPITLNVYLPPRPYPNAKPVVVREDFIKDFVGNIQQVASSTPYVLLRITNELSTSEGPIKPGLTGVLPYPKRSEGRKYVGRWYIYWERDKNK
jgi:hypothetical protein